MSLIERLIGVDPGVRLALSPMLDILDAYVTVHVLMRDGSMKRGGEAVAEVLRNSPVTRWWAKCFSIRIVGVRPFPIILNLSYAILADVRPVLGYESCGTPSRWLKPLVCVVPRTGGLFGGGKKPAASPHSSPSR